VSNEFRITRKKDVIEEIINELEEPATLNEIMEAFEDSTGETVTKEWIRETIRELEEGGKAETEKTIKDGKYVMLSVSPKRETP